jgi:hypothetical protein
MNDQELVELLRAKAPKAPPATPELEARIVAALGPQDAAVAPDVPDDERGHGVRRWPQALAGALAIAAALAFYLVTHRSASEAAGGDTRELEQFVESSWDGAFDDDAELQYLTAGLDDVPTASQGDQP